MNEEINEMVEDIIYEALFENTAVDLILSIFSISNENKIEEKYIYNIAYLYQITKKRTNWSFEIASWGVYSDDIYNAIKMLTKYRIIRQDFLNNKIFLTLNASSASILNKKIRTIEELKTQLIAFKKVIGLNKKEFQQFVDLIKTNSNQTFTNDLIISREEKKPAKNKKEKIQKEHINVSTKTLTLDAFIK